MTKTQKEVYNEYLIQANECLPTSDKFKVIRCNLFDKWLKTQYVTDNSCDKYCNSCGINFENLPYRVHYQPAKKPNKFLRKLLKKKNKVKTKFQLRCEKRYNLLQNRQYMIITCQSCKKKTKKYIIVPQSYQLNKNKEKKKDLKIVKTLKKGKKNKPNSYLQAKKQMKRNKKIQHCPTKKFLNSKKVDSNLIVLDTPKASDDFIPLDSNSRIAENVTNEKNSNSRIINLITPKKKERNCRPLSNKQDQNCSIINLISPEKQNNTLTEEKSSKKKNKSKKLNGLSLFINNKTNTGTKVKSNLGNFMKWLSDD